MEELYEGLCGTRGLSRWSLGLLVLWLHGSWTFPGSTSCQSAQAVLQGQHPEPRRTGTRLGPL